MSKLNDGRKWVVYPDIEFTIDDFKNIQICKKESN